MEQQPWGYWVRTFADDIIQRLDRMIEIWERIAVVAEEDLKDQQGRES
jgi:hypothetical protein